MTDNQTEPFGYWVEQKGADPLLLRKPAYIPEPSPHRTVTPLYREIDALGGVGAGNWHEGYTTALTDVLNILERRGFSEVADAMPTTARNALEAILRLPTQDVHVGYDNGSGGGNHLYADFIPADEAFALAQAGLSAHG